MIRPIVIKLLPPRRLSWSEVGLRNTARIRNRIVFGGKHSHLTSKASTGPPTSPRLVSAGRVSVVGVRPSGREPTHIQIALFEPASRIEGVKVACASHLSLRSHSALASAGSPQRRGRDTLGACMARRIRGDRRPGACRRRGSGGDPEGVRCARSLRRDAALRSVAKEDRDQPGDRGQERSARDREAGASGSPTRRPARIYPPLAKAEHAKRGRQISRAHSPPSSTVRPVGEKPRLR
jgi:hypothetical protein